MSTAKERSDARKKVAHSCPVVDRACPERSRREQSRRAWPAGRSRNCLRFTGGRRGPCIRQQHQENRHRQRPHRRSIDHRQAPLHDLPGLQRRVSVYHIRDGADSHPKRSINPPLHFKCEFAGERNSLVLIPESLLAASAALTFPILRSTIRNRIWIPYVGVQ